MIFVGDPREIKLDIHQFDTGWFRQSQLRAEIKNSTKGLQNFRDPKELGVLKRPLVALVAQLAYGRVEAL